jgi:hypothetical protein
MELGKTLASQAWANRKHLQGLRRAMPPRRPAAAG